MKILGWLKKFGPAQNILGPVKGQGMNANHLFVWHKKFGPAQNILGPGKGQGISVYLSTTSSSDSNINLRIINFFFIKMKVIIYISSTEE